MRPSGPRTTDGRSCSDSRAFKRLDGRRDTVLAVSVLPSSAVVGDAGASVGASAITVVVSCARPIERTILLAVPRSTLAVSKPSIETTSMSPLSAGSMANVPSPAVTIVVTT